MCLSFLFFVREVCPVALLYTLRLYNTHRRENNTSAAVNCRNVSGRISIIRIAANATGQTRRRYVPEWQHNNGWGKKNKPAAKPRSLRSSTVSSPRNVRTFSAWRGDTVDGLRARWRSPVGSLLTLARWARAGGDKTRSIHPRGSGCTARPRRIMYQTLTDMLWAFVSWVKAHRKLFNSGYLQPRPPQADAPINNHCLTLRGGFWCPELRLSG